MKRNVALALLCLGLVLSVPAAAQIYRGPNSARHAQKASKKDRKKYSKEQQKAMKKYAKQQRKAAKRAKQRG